MIRTTFYPIIFILFKVCKQEPSQFSGQKTYDKPSKPDTSTQGLNKKKPIFTDTKRVLHRITIFAFKGISLHDSIWYIVK